MRRDATERIVLVAVLAVLLFSIGVIALSLGCAIATVLGAAL